MKKPIITLLIILAIIFVLNQSGVFSALFVFLLIGAVPGTLHSISPSIMLAGILAVVWLIIVRSTLIPYLANIRLNHRAKQYAERLERTPKHRFGRL